LGPLGTAATNRPIVPAPGDYDDGEIGGTIGRGNQSTRRKPAPMPKCKSSFRFNDNKCSNTILHREIHWQQDIITPQIFYGIS
jgi:hypothetical protein